MASYKIEWKKSASKELRNLNKPIIPRILEAVENLAVDPFPHGVRKLIGSKHTYRIRVGEYRIIYAVFESVLIIEIIRIRHRRKAYKK